MSEIFLNNNGKSGQVNSGQLAKGGVKREQIKDTKLQQLFDFADKNKDGVLDASELEEMMKNVNTDEDAANISAKEAKNYLNSAKQQNKELKELKSEDLFEFLKEINQNSENIKESKFSVDANGNKTVYITYNDGTLETVFPDKAKEIKTTENNVTITKRYENGGLTRETKEADGETTVTDYEEDGKTPSKTTITSATGEWIRTISYTQGVQVSAVVEHGAQTITYIYDKNGKEVKQTEEINRDYKEINPALYERTDFLMQTV